MVPKETPQEYSDENSSSSEVETCDGYTMWEGSYDSTPCSSVEELEGVEMSTSPLENIERKRRKLAPLMALGASGAWTNTGTNWVREEK